MPALEADEVFDDDSKPGTSKTSIPSSGEKQTFENLQSPVRRHP
jgi:hypothetical protein